MKGPLKCHERDDYPQAQKDGSYSCCHCGHIDKLKRGDKLICRQCYISRPLVLMDEKQKAKWGDPPCYLEKR